MKFYEKMCFLKSALTVLAFTLAAQTAFAILPAPGDTDASFNGGVPTVIDLNSTSTDLHPYAAAVNPLNGDILWAGSEFATCLAPCSPSKGFLAVYKPDGSLDTAIGSSGEITLTPDQAGFTGSALVFQAVDVDGQGRFLAAGFIRSSSNAALVLARFNPDGSLDTSFGAAGTGIVTDSLNGGAGGSVLALTGDGHILVTGGAYDAGHTQVELTVWRFNSDGSADTDFGGSGHVQIPTINTSDLDYCSGSFASSALQPGGTLIAGCTLGNGGPWKLTRLNPDGSVDTSFGSSGFVTGASGMELTGLALAPDGGFVISEEDMSSTPYCYDLHRFLADGSVDSGFNGGSPLSFPFSCTNQFVPLPLAVQPDGKIIAAGNNGASLAVGRFLADGTPDGSFGTTAFGYSGFAGIDFHGIDGNDYAPLPTAGLLQGDGKIVVSGYAQYSSGSGYNASFVTRLINDAFNFTPDAVSFTNQTNVNPSTTVTSNAVTISGLTSGVSVPVHVTGGEYKINSGAWTSTPGLTQDGDQIAVRQTSSSSYSTTTTATLTVGGEAILNNNATVLGTPLSADFTSTTEAAPSGSGGSGSSSGGGGGGSLGGLGLLLLIGCALLAGIMRQQAES